MTESLEELLQRFYNDLANNQVEMPPEIKEVIYNNLWELYDEPEMTEKL